MSRRVYRYEVPVDDCDHELTVHGQFRHVASRNPEVVEVWVEHDPNVTGLAFRFRVFGTGQVIPDGALWFGTALAPCGLVWHLYAVPPAVTP